MFCLFFGLFRKFSFYSLIILFLSNTPIISQVHAFKGLSGGCEGLFKKPVHGGLHKNPPLPEDSSWDSRFAFGGLDGLVQAVAVSGNDVYVGGYFTAAGGVNTPYIAKWDGSQWSSLGEGLNPNGNGLIYAVKVMGGKGYAGGSFITPKGGSLSYIAAWDGLIWFPLGEAVDGIADDIAIKGNDLYAGGEVTTAAGIQANHIAKWDGAAWHGLGSGVSGDVLAMARLGSELYAGGWFTKAGGKPSSCFARWAEGGILSAHRRVEQPMPINFSLNQNFPDPFNGVTNIQLSLPQESNVSLAVYDLLVREVCVLLSERKGAGEYRISWNSQRVSSGVYLYLLAAGRLMSIKPMILSK